MRIHKEGYAIILTTAAIVVAISAISFLLINPIIASVISFVLVGLLLFILRFFRVPSRPILCEDGVIFAPADGTVVVIEPTNEPEYLGDTRIQVSIFMSVWNVHINWYCVAGVLEYFRHHHGKFMVAWHPKSSEENERTTTVVNTGREKILFRQVAGILARRIVSYAVEGETVTQNSQCGFIKFGSRIDLFLPTDSEIVVDLKQKVTGSQTVIARLKR